MRNAVCDGDDLLGRWLRLEQHFSFGVFHAANECGGTQQTLIGERGIGRRHRHQRDFARAERERRHARHVAHPHLLRLRDGFRDAHFLEHAHGRAIARRAQRCPHGHRRSVRMLVFGNPRTLQRLDRLVEPRDERGRRITRLERRRIHKGLERRARLAKRLRRAVETAGLEIAATDHRAHFAGRGIHRDERGLQLARRLGATFLFARRISICCRAVATCASAARCMAGSIVV